MRNLLHPVVCIVGPTSSGKTMLAQAYAEHVGAEIISADSMQIYRGMDIGTGKIPLSERTVPYHGLDIADPGEPYSAALFQADARKALTEIDSRGRQAVIAGGTGFYVRAAIDDYRFPKGEQEDNPVRARYERFLDEMGPHALWELLDKADPQSAACIHENNSKRVIRALEMYEEGESYAKLSESLKDIPQVYNAIFVGLRVDKDELNTRIDNRVDKMIEGGLENEVRELLSKGFREGVTAQQAIGYKEMVSYLDGQVSLDDAIKSIKQATRRYAKRQRTWFNKDKRIIWIDAADADMEKMLLDVMDIVNENTERQEA